MCRKFLYGAAILALFYFPSYAHAYDYFLEWRSFTVRDDLAPGKSKKINTAAVTQEVLEEYLAGTRKYGGIVGTKEDKKTKQWDEFQYGGLLLRLSRYHDWKSPQDISRPGGGSSLWETIKSFSSQLDGAPNRDTLESMGRIFTPEFDLSIEF